jgi:hypothetical protein
VFYPLIEIVASFYLKWDSFDEAVDTIWKANPKRTKENIASRVIHSLEEVLLSTTPLNYKKQDGKWGWKFDVDGLQTKFSQKREELWELAASIQCPTVLVRGEVLFCYEAC